MALLDFLRGGQPVPTSATPTPKPPYIWTGTLGGIVTGGQAYAFFTRNENPERELYKILKISIVNNDASNDAIVLPNNDSNRSVRLAKGGGSATITSGTIDFIVVQNPSGGSTTTANSFVFSGEAVLR